ncbi:putative RNA-binding protein EIF1AD [Branchiostoma floridae x Branchiostoma belcheri]
MSKTTKKKHVAREVLEEFVLPEGDQQIVRVVASRGGNLHEVETVNGDHFLASMPTKFRKNIWIKRGDHVIVEPIEEGDKVRAEIQFVLYRDQIKYIIEEGAWPQAFEVLGLTDKQQDQNGHQTESKADPLGSNNNKGTPADSDEDEDSDNDDDLFVNTNRPVVEMYTDTEDSSEEEEEEEEEYRQEDGEAIDE